MNKIEKQNLVFSILTDDRWITYQEIRSKINNVLSIAGVSQTVTDLCIAGRVETDVERYGAKEWQERIIVKLKSVN